MKLDSKIFVAGHRGLVGSALVRRLEAEGYANILLRSKADLDLRDQAATRAFFKSERPEYVFLAAAKVGGIRANDTYPAEFLHDNLAIQTNVIDAAWREGTQKLLFLGSSCIYPRDASQPIVEDALLSGPLERTNEWYAIAKIAGLKMCQAYRRQYGFRAVSAMPTNLYGPHDNFDPLNAHVLPALLRRFHEATERRDSEVVIWGTGRPLREFLHADDLAAALLHIMRKYDEEETLNVGSGAEVSIAELARLIADITGFNGEVRLDPSKPDGTPRKLLDSSRIRKLGWAPSITLREGIAATYEWYKAERRAMHVGG